MTREEYISKRNEMMNAAQKYVSEGKIEEFKAEKIEIEALDKQFEDEAKAQTELDALNAGVRFTNIAQRSMQMAGTTIDTTDNSTSDDITNTKEYRKAFMNYVTQGTSIPDQFKNSDANTKTTDVGEMIPNTVLEKIIEKMESVGMILPLVTRTALKGGVTVPTSSVKPVATWVAQGAGSDKQKKTTGSITFAYHKLRCAVSVSLEVDEMALAVFEQTIINNIAEAMVKALEQSIINGSGTGQPKGILKETLDDGQKISTASITYQTLIDAEAALPIAYEKDAIWCMTKKTFMQCIGIVDKDGQPIARVNYGIAGKPERAILGRQVILCDYLDSFSNSLEAEKEFAFLFNFKDYVLNTNFNMGIKDYYNEETDDRIKKSVMLVDGKVIDKNSLVVLKKATA